MKTGVDHRLYGNRMPRAAEAFAGKSAKILGAHVLVNWYPGRVTIHGRDHLTRIESQENQISVYMANVFNRVIYFVVA